MLRDFNKTESVTAKKRKILTLKTTRTLKRVETAVMKLSAEEESQSHSDAVISVQSAHDSAVSSHSDHKVL